MNESHMDSDTYFELQIENVPNTSEETLTLFLFESGASGVHENLAFEQTDRKYLPEIVEKDFKVLTAFFSNHPGEAFLKKLNFRFPEITLRLNQEPVKDWLSEWKAQWKPFCLVEDFWIVPDWEKENFPSQDRHCIFIEPGMAFGTGTHATTQLASRFIHSLRDKKMKTFLDVGTGSGILAILARKLGFEKGYAYDNDGESHRVFLENLEKNQVDEIDWEKDWSTKLTGQVDLLIANIIDGVLVELKEEFKAVKPNYCVFTGVLEERAKDFVAEMTENWNLKLIEESQQDEWKGFVFEVQE